MDPQVLTASLAVFTVVGLGFLLRRVNWLTHEADESLLKLVIRVLMPCLILSVVMDNRAIDDRSNLMIPPVVGYGLTALGFAVGWLVARLMGPKLGLQTAVQQRTFALCVGMFNYGYIPVPLCESLFDQETLGVMFIHNVGVELCMWTLGIALISGRLGLSGLKRIINPPSVAIVLALFLNLTNTADQLPAFLLKIIPWLGVCAIPVALLMIGATVADHFRKRDIVQGKRIMGSALLLRLGLLPAAFLLAAWFVPGSTELKRVVVLEAAMPSAVFPIVLARHYGGDVRTAVRVVLATSLVSLITMPAWIALGRHLILGSGGG